MAFSDTFTGSNGAALNSTNWETPTGASAPLINTNAAYGTGTASIARQKAVTSNDQYAETTIGSMPVNAEGLGPAVRISGTAKTGYVASCSQWDDGNDYGPQITLYRCVNGSYTGLGSYTGAAYSSLGAVRITISGYAITVTDGGTTRITYTDTSGSKIASGNPGIWFQQNSSAYRLDNYTATDQGSSVVNATEGFPAAATTSSGSMGQTAGTITAVGFAGAATTASGSVGQAHSSSTGFAGASSTSSGSMGQTVGGITYPRGASTYSDDFQGYTVGSSVQKLADGVSFSPWKSPTNIFPFVRTESGRTGLGVGATVNQYPTVVWEAPISPNHYSAADFVRAGAAEYRSVVLYVRGQRYSAQGYSLTFSQQYDGGTDTYYEQIDFRRESGSTAGSLGTVRIDNFATPTKIRLEAASVDANSPVRLRAFADDVLLGTVWDSAGTFQSGYPGLNLNSGSTTHVLVDDWSTGVVATPPTDCTVGFTAAVATASSAHGLPVSASTGFAAAASTSSGSMGLPFSTTVAFPAVPLTSSSALGQVTSRAKASAIYPAFSAFGGLDSYTGLQKGQITANGDPTIGYRLGIGNDGTKGDRVFLTVPAASLLRADTPSNAVGKATLHVTFLSLMSWDYLSGTQAWASRSYARAEYVTNAGNVYFCTSAGTSTAAPTGTGAGLTPGGTAVWDFVRTHSAPAPSGTAFTVRKADAATWGATLSGSYGTVTAKPVWLSGQTWYDGTTRGSPVWECEVDITTLYNESAQPGTDLILCLECGLSDPRWVAELAGAEMAWARPRIEVHRYTASAITLSDTDTACPTLTVTPGSGSTLGEIRWSYDEAMTPQGGVFKYANTSQVEGRGTASPFTFPMLESSARVFVEVEVDNGANGTLVFKRSFKTPQVFAPKLEAKSGAFGSDWLDVRGPCLAPPTAAVEAWYLLAKRTTSEWAASTSYPAGAAVVANGKRWFTKTGGTSGATAPSTASTSAGTSDGAVTWFPVQLRDGTWKAGAIGDFWELYRCTDAAYDWKHHVGTFDASNVNTVDPLPWPSYNSNSFTYNGATYLIQAGPDVTLDALDVSHPVYEHHGRVAFLSTKIAGAGYEVRLNVWRHDAGGEVDWGVNNWPAGIVESSVVLYTATAQPTLKDLATVARAADWRHSMDRDPYTPLIAAFIADGHLRVYSVPTTFTYPDSSNNRLTYGIGTPTLEQNVAVSNITSVQALHLLTHEGEHRTIIAARGTGAGWIGSRADTTVTFTNGGGYTLGGGAWSTPITPTFETAWVTETMHARARGSSLTTGEIVEHLPDAETCCLAVQASNGVVTFFKGDLVQSACTVASLEPAADFGTGLLWNRSARVVGRWPTTGYARTVPTPNGGAFMLRSSGSTLSAYRVSDFGRVSDVKSLDVGSTVQEILVQRDGFAWEGQRVPVVTKHSDGYRTSLVTVGVDPWKLHLPTPDQVARFSSGKATMFQGSPNMRPVQDIERLAGHNVFATGWSFDEFRNSGGMMTEAGWCYTGFEHADGERVRLLVHDNPCFGGKWRGGTLLASTYDAGFHPECLGGVTWPQTKFATWFYTNDAPSTPNRQWHRVLDGMDYVLDGESGGGMYVVCVKSAGPVLWLAHDMVSDIETWRGDVSQWLAADAVKLSSQQRVKWVNAQGELLDVNGGILSQVRVAP